MAKVALARVTNWPHVGTHTGAQVADSRNARKKHRIIRASGCPSIDAQTEFRPRATQVAITSLEQKWLQIYGSIILYVHIYIYIYEYVYAYKGLHKTVNLDVEAE